MRSKSNVGAGLASARLRRINLNGREIYAKEEWSYPNSTNNNDYHNANFSGNDNSNYDVWWFTY